MAGKQDEDLETVRVFGLKMFGAESAKWDDELFFYRCGIAMRDWKQGNGQ